MKTLDDVGNAERFAQMYADRIKYVGDVWRIWDGARWVVTKNVPFAMVTDMLASLGDEVEDAPYFEQMALTKHAARSRSEKSISAMLKLAKTARQLEKDAGAFDDHPTLLNCRNGVLDLETGELGPHDPELLLTKIAKVDHDKAAMCPHWKAHIELVMAGDREMVEYVQRALGYTLSGFTNEQVMFVAVGTGANGKSVIVDVLDDLLGDYAEAADQTLLIQSKANETGHNLVQLKGARFVKATETKMGAKLDEVAVKVLTGSERVSGRLLYQNNQSFRPSAKVWLVTNHKPVVSASDDGTWRRLREIPFTVTIPEEARIEDYGRKLLAEEGPGILNWLAAGYRKWRKVRLKTPRKVLDAVARYRTAEDDYQLIDFLGDVGGIVPGARASEGRLVERYLSWYKDCADEDTPKLAKRLLIKRLAQFGIRATVWTEDGMQLRGVEGLDLGHEDLYSDDEPTLDDYEM